MKHHQIDLDAVADWREGPCDDDMLASCFWHHRTAERDRLLSALREPSPATIKAGVDFAMSVSLGGDYKWPDYMRDLWAVMFAAMEVRDAG